MDQLPPQLSTRMGQGPLGWEKNFLWIMESLMKQSFTNTTIVSLIMIIVGLLIIFVWTPFTNFKAEVGLSLITAGIVSLTIDNVSIKEISIRLNKVVEDGLHELVMKKYGIAEITATTPYGQIYNGMKSSKEFTLVQTWSPDMKNILDHCELVLARGGTVTIFLLDPESPAAKQRSLDLQEKIEHVPEKIRSDADQIRSMYHRLLAKQNRKLVNVKKRLRLFYYQSLPSFALYKTDRTAWVAFYWYCAQSDSGMNLVIDFQSDNPARKHYERHLKFLEDNSSPVSLGNDTAS